MLYPIAALEDDKLTAIRALEKDLGSPVVALEPVHATSADLPEEKLRKLQELESELGVVLVAVEPE